jgi:PPM family protein phosphatase
MNRKSTLAAAQSLAENGHEDGAQNRKSVWRQPRGYNFEGMIQAAGLSDPGCVRPNNEDYYLLAPSLGLFVVADGMGGAQAGETASKIAAESVAQFVWDELETKAAEETVLLEAVKQANQSILDEAVKDPSLHGMGTTIVAALELDSGDVHVVSVGDSRAYLSDGNEWRLLTEDQTWVNEIGRRLGLDDDSLRVHPMRHVLTMALGVGGQLRINHYRVSVKATTQILLCSDGLHAVLTDETIRTVLATAETPDEKCSRLVELARAGGGPDNITVVLLSRQTDQEILHVYEPPEEDQVIKVKAIEEPSIPDKLDAVSAPEKDQAVSAESSDAASSDSSETIVATTSDPVSEEREAL